MNLGVLEPDILGAAAPGDAPNRAGLGAPRLIGPNALIQPAAAMRALCGSRWTEKVFDAAGLHHRLATPPRTMIPAHEAGRLNRALYATLPGDLADRVTAEAGRRLGDYLLAHRIPWIAQGLIRWAPGGLGRRMLYGAMGRNAGTFAGAERFTVDCGPVGDRIRIDGSALSTEIRGSDRPVCGLFAGTFERLLRRLVDDRIRVREIACAGQRAAPDPMGPTAPCVFEAQRL